MTGLKDRHNEETKHYGLTQINELREDTAGISANKALEQMLVVSAVDIYEDLKYHFANLCKQFEITKLDN